MSELTYKRNGDYLLPDLGLTEEEKVEQAELRAEYLAEFRKNFRRQLEDVRFVEDLTEAELEEIAREKNLM